MFFFYFDNIATRGKEQNNKAYELLTNLHGEKIQFYYEIFTRDGEMVLEARDYTTFKTAFLEKYQSKEDPGTTIKTAVEVRLDMEGLRESLHTLEEIYTKEKFIQKAKLAMLQKLVKLYPDLAGMALDKGT